ncbi:MAG: hypothetical protein QME89_08750, partial [Actinomycetota bacterium]|nr:hypothetical protein [Actinomycetota bacterium]
NYERVRGLLSENRRALEGIAEILLEKETLEGDVFRSLLEKFSSRAGMAEEPSENLEEPVAENR